MATRNQLAKLLHAQHSHTHHAQHGCSCSHLRSALGHPLPKRRTTRHMAFLIPRARRRISMKQPAPEWYAQAGGDVVNVRRRLARKQAAPPWYPPPLPTDGAPQHMKGILEDLGGECTADTAVVYLVTISRVLPEAMQREGFADITTMSSEQVGAALRNAFDNPLPQPGRAGRPRIIEESFIQKMVVFREAHSDGTPHFHVAVKLSSPRGWKAAKDALRERDRLPSHWSASHTQFWSAVRYGHIPTPKKPIVDQAPYQWTRDGHAMNLFEESQQPFQASMWKRRREALDASECADPSIKKKRFGKLDLTAVILDKGLRTKAEVMEYAQEHGTEQLQVFVHNNQKKLAEYLADAREWASAREDAATERETDWALLCRTAGAECAHGRNCSYVAAAQRFFHANEATIDKEALAASLRGIILNGPSKTTRVPLVVGATNTGKSTLVLPFDQLFGHSKVFHKPAMKSTFPLANIRKGKRFLFWDDYRPVEYAQKTIPVNTYLSLFQGTPFEVAVSGSFNDGNEDFLWSRGAVMTAKEQGLWDVRGDVSAEDVRHMQNRHVVFRAVAKLSSIRDTDPCAPHMCAWILEYATAFDARQALRPALGNGVASLPLVAPGEHERGMLEGMTELASRAQIEDTLAMGLSAELQGLGAVHVREVGLSDWVQLGAWRALRPFEQRRLHAAVLELLSA